MYKFVEKVLTFVPKNDCEIFKRKVHNSVSFSPSKLGLTNHQCFQIFVIS